MILLIDNYDSFSYNLYQMIGACDPEIRVIRNDEMSVEQIRELRPGNFEPEDFCYENSAVLWYNKCG